MLLQPALLQAGNRVDRTATRGQHGIDHHDDGAFVALGHLIVVLLGQVGLLVAHKADMAHVGKGHELQQTVDHAEAGAQYGHDGEEVVLEDGEGGAANWRVDLAQLGGKVARDLVAHQDGDFLEKRPELRRGGVAIAHVGELGLDERMVDDVHACHGLRLSREVVS